MALDDHYEPDFREWLLDPRKSLQAYGHVQDQEYDWKVEYDPYRLTDRLQATILSYVADPPRTADGHTRWLVQNKYRQAGASTTTALAFYVKAQYSPGWEHVQTADTKERADYLFSRVMYNHRHWPEELKEPQSNTAEKRQLSWEHGGNIRVLSGQQSGMGIGRGPSSFAASEVPLWPDAAKQWNYLAPSMLNRKNALMVWESTPFPLEEASAIWYRDLCTKAKYNKGRWIYSFQPFWDGKLNRRDWVKGWNLSNEEIRLLERFGPFGLTKENLAFRRFVMETDDEVSKNPELFRIFYPFDDVTCWVSGANSVIRQEHLERHLGDLVGWNEHHGFMQYRDVKDDAQYVVGVDPAGYGARDHAAFHVLEVWADRWEQVYTFGKVAKPREFNDHLIEVAHKFNNAMIVVERNGVGLGTIEYLKAKNYPNLYHDRHRKPGIYKSSEMPLLTALIDALVREDGLVIHDENTVEQLQSYQSDKTVEVSVKAELLRARSRGRRERHHWDKVSALMIACAGAATLPTRYAPRPARQPLPRNVINLPELTLKQWEERAKAQRKFRRKGHRKGRRARYTPIRRGRG